ncbi:hypothetical protein [Saccharibacillus sp. O23]|uniref:hypothetical protein n=1 Tax=Saccharibacillus sp. O23 TaxID=2009338 RepID=UPI001179E532|nr:hypothetical protein [Saccharibacillus sp. O23]
MFSVEPRLPPEKSSSAHSRTRFDSAHEAVALIALAFGLLACILLIGIWLERNETLADPDDWLAKAAFDFLIMPLLTIGDVVFAALGLAFSLAVVKYPDTRLISIIGICSSSLALAGLFVSYLSWM